jgi:uncharacterized protein with HEPN domain
MNDRDRLSLRHVLSAIDEIASFTVEGQRACMADRKPQGTVIRQLETAAGCQGDLKWVH